MSEQAGAQAQTAVLTVEGMHCQSCVLLIEETLVEDLGVASASVDLASARATVTYDPARFTVSDLCDAVVAAGYTAVPAGS
jgi:copper chaperone CopZ